MAVTKEKGKTRLDFSGAMSEMLSQSKSTPKKEAEAVVEPLDIPPVTQEIEIPKVEMQPQMVIPQKAEPLKKEKSAQPVKEKPIKAETALEKRLLSSKKSRGVQKSVYLEADIYDYIENLSEKYHLKFSAVLNELLRELIP